MANSAEAAGTNDIAITLNGNFKKVYAPNLSKIIPSSVKILPEIDFIPAEKQGGLDYNVPVVLANEHGVTYGGPDGDAFALNAPIAGRIKQATVKGNEIVLRSFLSYGAASRAEKSMTSFVRSTKHLVENIVESITKKLEAEVLYGQMGLATADVVSPVGDLDTFHITDIEFASGLWAGSEGMALDFRPAGGGASRLGVPSYVESVDLDAKTVKTSTADLAGGGVLATDVVYEWGAYGMEFAGIHKILTNTGELFGLNAAEYNLWKSTEYAVNGPLSLNAINIGLSKAAGRGLDEDVKLYVSPPTWTQLSDEDNVYRSQDSSYKSEVGEAGHRSLKFHTQTGMVEVIPHTYVKEGYAFALCLKEFEKVGSTDVTFKIPGKGEEFFRPLENSAGYELRCYADWAIFCHKPNKQLLFTDIDWIGMP